MTKLCTDCEHRSSKHYGTYCGNPKLGISHIDGFSMYENCRTVRGDYHKCGPDAFWFEPEVSVSQTLKNKIWQLLKLN